jgi:tetratricopeptide (TPR) repeat protein
MQVYTLMGRANEVQGDLTTAYSMFTQALLLAQRLDDSFSLARIQTNLAAVFLQTGKYIEAHELLNEAYVTQRRMGDTTGLHSTQYNRQLLEQRIAG